MLEQVERLNSGILSVSDADRYVTLLLAEIDVQKRKLQYVNCGHNPALLFRATTGTPTHLDSPCPPIGLSPEEICELSSANLAPGDVVVFYTDGVTEAKTPLGEEFGMERLSATVRSGSANITQRFAKSPVRSNSAPPPLPPRFFLSPGISISVPKDPANMLTAFNLLDLSQVIPGPIFSS
jgi:hypothetical protein